MSARSMVAWAVVCVSPRVPWQSEVAWHSGNMVYDPIETQRYLARSINDDPGCT